MEKKYLEDFGLERTFSLEQLLESFKVKMTSLKNESNENNQKLKKAINYNNGLNMLRLYASNTSSSNLFSDKVCYKVGLSFDEAQKLYKKQELRKFDSLPEFISQIYELYKNKKEFIRYTLSYMDISLSTWIMPFDKLLSIYFSDCNGTDYKFDLYVGKLAEVCNEIEGLDKSQKVSLEDEFNEFLNSRETRFIEFLARKLRKKYICYKLNTEEYQLRHQYEYESENFRGTFDEYLDRLYEMHVKANELGLKGKQLEDAYNEYLMLDNYGSMYDFITEFYAVKDCCNGLTSIYFSYKRRYLEIPRSERMQSFIEWIKLCHVKAHSALTSDQIIERLYLNEQAKGYTGEIDEFLTSIVNMTNDSKPKRKRLS